MFIKVFGHFLILLFLITPSFLSAQIIFSEIMYNPLGKDSGYEWVEIKNTYNFSLSLEKYKFCEGKPTCRSWVKNKNENFEIKAGAYAIITDDKEKFLEKFPNYSELILVSSGFTLTNTGELIQIKNPEGNLDDSLIFKPDPKSQEGDTLSVFNNIWKNSQPSPGTENIYKDVNDEKENSKKKEEVNTSYVQITDKVNGKKKLKAEIDPVGVLVVGARSPFYGRAYGLSGVEISGIDFYWNFGDGKTDYGQKVYHSYSFPNDYIVNLIVKSGNFTGETKVRVKVIEPDIIISEIVETSANKEGYIKIKNNSNYILNLEDWMLFVDGERFLIPAKTFIDKKGELIFPNKITSLKIFNNDLKKSNIQLLLPNSQKFFQFNFIDEKISEEKKEKVSEKVFAKKDKQVLQKKKNHQEKKEKIIPQKEAEVKVTEKVIENQEASILRAFKKDENNFQEIILKNNNSFLKDNWLLFLLSLFFLFFLFFIIYLRSKIDKKELGEKIEKEEEYNLIDEEAEEYEIKEMK